MDIIGIFHGRILSLHLYIFLFLVLVDYVFVKIEEFLLGERIYLPMFLHVFAIIIILN